METSLLLPCSKPAVFFLDTPLKINMEHNYEGLEDDFPFQLGGFLGSMIIFRGAFGIPSEIIQRVRKVLFVVT